MDEDKSGAAIPRELIHELAGPFTWRDDTPGDSNELERFHHQPVTDRKDAHAPPLSADVLSGNFPSRHCNCWSSRMLMIKP